MKEALTRFLFYLFITIVITSPFRSSWPDAAVTEPLAAKLTFYFTYYGIGWIFCALLLLSIHEAFRWARRRRRGNLITGTAGEQIRAGDPVYLKDGKFYKYPLDQSKD